MNKNKSYNNEFKYKVALEMIRGDLTLAEIISKYKVPRSVISRWKKQFLDNGASIFKNPNQSNQDQNKSELEKLHATIGRLKVENDFLQDCSVKLRK
jgi:transposase